jgi:hypothetical protein
MIDPHYAVNNIFLIASSNEIVVVSSLTSVNRRKEQIQLWKQRHDFNLSSDRHP